MRKWVVMGLIGVLALLPAAAFADVDIDVDIEKDKRKIVFEKVVKFKAALILAIVLKITDEAAESETLVNQTNTGNFEFDFFASSNSTGDVNGNSGITGVNLASGNMNNQANAVSVAVAGGDNNGTNDRSLFIGGSFAESQAGADQKNYRNDVVTKFWGSFSNLTVSDNSGITGVNQASGHMNNQANAVSVAIGTAPAIALSEADLGQVNAWNTAISIFSGSFASASVSGNTGITGVNQSSGHMNNQANVVSVAATR
jgi:hypothetical protein